MIQVVSSVLKERFMLIKKKLISEICPKNPGCHIFMSKMKEKGLT